MMLRRISLPPLLPIASLCVLTCKEPAGPTLADQVLLSGPSIIHLGGRGQFRATLLDADGDTLRFHPVEWSSSDTTIASVTQLGLVTARALGSATIRAAADGKVGTAPLLVTLVPVRTVDVMPRGIDSLYVGDSLQLTAPPRDSVGGVLSNRSIAWMTSDTAKATVSATGLVRARAAGSFTVTATSEGKTGGTFLNAQLRAVALIMPDSFTIGLHHVARLIPDLESASGTHLSGRLMTWASSNPQVLIVQQTGVLEPQQLGTATIYARNGDLTDSSLVTVVTEPIASIGISWIAAVPIADTTVEALEASAVDSTNLPTVGDAITWTTSDTSVLRVAPSPTDHWRALLTGLHPGTVRISATSGPATGSFNYTLVYPMAQFMAQPDSVMLAAGEIRGLKGAALDRFGNRLDVGSFLQTATSQDTTIAYVGIGLPIYIGARRPGRTTVIVRLSNGLTDTVPIIVTPTSAPRLHWTADFVTSYNYDSVRVELFSADSNGVISSQPRDIQLLSTDSTVAVPAQPAITGMIGAQTVTIRVRKSGFATIMATGDSQFASLWVTVSEASPFALQLDPAPPVLRMGDSLRLHATLQGHPYPVTWKTVDASRATVSDSGTVSAVGVGDVSIVAAAGPVSDTAVFTILSTTPPAVVDVTPLPLVPGAVVMFKGSGFEPDPAANVVLIDSIAAVITAASDTQLTLTLPPAGAWACALTHKARVLITSGGRLGLDSFPLSVATQRNSLAPGEALSMTGSDAACNELAPTDGSASYVVSIANTSLTSPTAFTFRGAATTLSPSTPAPKPEAVPAAIDGASPVYRVSFDSLRHAALVHRQLLERSRVLSTRAGAPAPLLRAARQLQPQRSVTATINGVAVVRIPRLEDPDFCSSYQSISANVVYAGTHVLILEDRMAPLAGRLAADYQALGREFDEVMFPELLAQFGNPLALDSLLDGDGRIAMVFSPVVNRYGLAGFVVSCDFYPESIAPSSNTGEIFYAQVPTAPGTGFGAYTVDVWRWLIRSVVMHESKHLTAFAERLSRGSRIEDTWLEEASAVLAEELWSRPIYGTTWKGEAVYRWTLYCDVRPTFPECAGRPYSMFNAFAFLYDYVNRLEQRTPLGPTSFDDATFYGSGWSFLRWAIDQSSGSESDFLRQLVQEPSLTGVANLTARTQRPYAEMLSDWSDALYYDAWEQTPPRPAWSMPSWKIEDIFRGMNSDFPTSFPDGHPLRGHAWTVGGTFSFTTPKLPPGGWALFVGNGTHLSPQLFDLHATNGGPPPAAVRVQIVRLQ